MFFALQTDKNFSGEVKEFDSLSEVGIGDFVRTDGEYWDTYGITLETTNTVYGIETSTDTSEGNTYVIMTKPITEETNFEEALETFIFRYAAGSRYDTAFNSLGADEYILSGLEGEVKNLSTVESVDSGPTATEYFNQFLTEFNAQEETYRVLLAEPEFIIDGRVVQANMVSDILLPSGVILVIRVIGLITFFVLNKKHIKEMDEFIMRVEGKKSKSPIERADKTTKEQDDLEFEETTIITKHRKGKYKKSGPIERN